MMNKIFYLKIETENGPNTVRYEKDGRMIIVNWSDNYRDAIKMGTDYSCGGLKTKISIINPSEDGEKEEYETN